MFVAAISHGNRFGDVVGNRSRGGPDVAVARNVAADVEVVEHTILLRQRVLIWGDVRAIHGEGRIATADAKIAEHLIVGAILFDDVYHVLDPIWAGREADTVCVAAEGVAVPRLIAESLEAAFDLGDWQAGEGAAQHREHIRVIRAAVRVFANGLRVGTRAVAFGAGNKQILLGGGDYGRIPFGRYERGGFASGEMKDRHGIGDGIGGEEILFVRGQRQRLRVAAPVGLSLRL